MTEAHSKPASEDQATVREDVAPPEQEEPEEDSVSELARSVQRLGKVRWTIISNAVSALALTVSVATAITSYSMYRDSASTQAVKDIYGIFLQLQGINIDNSEISHITALPENYAAVASVVATTTENLTATERTQLLLRERTLAMYIFGIFEHALYQYNQAVGFGDDDRVAFLEEVLGYLTGRLLRNPRLLYYWSSEEIGISGHFEDVTHQYYRDHVLEDENYPLQYQADPEGPLRYREDPKSQLQASADTKGESND